MDYTKTAYSFIYGVALMERMLHSDKAVGYSSQQHLKTETGVLRITRYKKGLIRIEFRDIDNNEIYFKDYTSDQFREIPVEDVLTDIVFRTDGNVLTEISKEELISPLKREA